jgi:putative oxidoreductase
MNRERSELATSLGLLVLRAGAGVMMLAGHGWGKLMSFGTLSQKFPDPLGVTSPVSLALAIFGELVCSVLVVLGVYTRLAAIPPLITMAVAAGIHHAGDPWADKELAVLYALVFLALIVVGGGRYALDRLWHR